MIRYRYQFASSADGFIADSTGGVSWLDDFFGVDYGFETFMSEIGAIVMGRISYESALQHAGPWPYSGKRTIVISNSRNAGPYVEFRSGNLRRLDSELAGCGINSVWVMGGGRTAASFLEAGMLTDIEPAVMPLVLGSGTPSLAPVKRPVRLDLAATKSFPNGVLLHHYRVRPATS
jgi:dihydrofolate reductase